MSGRAHVNGASNGSHNSNGHNKFGVLKLAYPGLGIKRWLLGGAFGISVCAVGLTLLLRKLYALGAPGLLPLHLEGVMLMIGGVAVIIMSLYGLFRSIGPLILASPDIGSIASTIYTRRSLGRGPRIVTIGGGTGLSVLLRGLKAYTDNLTAIVTVGDDGGSSGRLRKEMGVLPPGDFRNCLVAMSDAESLVTELFQYRFDQGDGLKGHSFGNLFIVAMTNVSKSFERALYESSRVLAVRGRIVPATVANLKLSARLKDGEMVYGESNIGERGGEIDQLFTVPSDAQAHPLAVEAIRDAQLIVIGPGSLYTSILPNLLVPGIAKAIYNSKAAKVYICNVATQIGETQGYAVADHLDALQKHTIPTIVDIVIANDTPIELGPQFFGTAVVDDGRSLLNAKLLLADLTDPTHPVRHDSAKLAQSTMNVYHKRRKGKLLLKR